MHKDFLDIIDYSPEELQALLDLAVELRKEYQAGGNEPVLKGKVLAMIFQKPSLRTRVSFDMAMRHLGGDALYLSPSEIGLGKREAIADIARVLEGYVHGIMARVFEHEHVLQLAQWAKIPVINGLSDYSHPCQAMADALTIMDKFGTLKDINVVYVGDGNNVAVSLMQICAKLGANFSIANPGLRHAAQIDQAVHQIAALSGTELAFFENPHEEAVRDCASDLHRFWISMGQEAETAVREKVFPPYQVNQQLVSEADPEVIVMHCCRRIAIRNSPMKLPMVRILSFSNRPTTAYTPKRRFFSP